MAPTTKVKTLNTGLSGGSQSVHTHAEHAGRRL